MTLTSVVLLYTGVRFLRGSDYFSTTEKYYAVFPSVDGLTVSNPVLVNGLAVGRVDKIQLLPERDNQLLVTLKVNNDVRVGDSSSVLIASSDLLGGKNITLLLGRSRKIYEGGDTLPGSRQTAFTDQLQAAAKPLFLRLDTTAAELNVVLRSFEVTGKKLNTLLETYNTAGNQVSGMLADNQGSIKNITSNISTLTRSLTQTEKDFKQLLSKLNRLGDTLNHAEIGRAVASANKSMENLNQMLANINKGQGTLGKLAKNDSLYRNLNASAASLNALLTDFKANPKSYVHFSVFGGGKKKGK